MLSTALFESGLISWPEKFFKGEFMDVLYVVGSCLTKNTSANMSHNAYVQGLLENGCNVDIIMAVQKPL